MRQAEPRGFARPTAARRTPGGLVASLALAAAALCGAARADKGISEGSFRDRDGKQHTWSVERSHLLLWDARPYAPAGVVFHSAYLDAPSPQALEQDGQELDRLRAAGIQDVWVDPRRGLLDSTPAEVQAIVDALEARGFHYGLRIGNRYPQPLVGFAPTITPLRVPVSRMQPGEKLQWEIPVRRGRRAAFALVSTADDERVHNYAVASGETIVEGDTTRIEIQLPNSRLLGKTRGRLYVVPEIQVEPEELGSFGDLWESMEAYVERLKGHLRGVRLGPGLRFLLDPFAAGDGTVGQEDQVFPSSDAFRAAFLEWLKRRVGGAQTVNASWRLTDRRLHRLEDAARLIPTWPRNDPPEGDGWLLDPVEKTAYRCRPRQCSIWEDLHQFRAETLKRLMNAVASTVKREVADVPVVFTWASYHPIFTNSPAPSGYDGLAAELYGALPGIARDSAAFALAQAEEADRNTWLIASRLAGPPDAAGSPGPIADSQQLRGLWEALRETGVRGVYLDPAQSPAAVTLARDLKMALGAEGADLGKQVRVCFFPLALATADRVTRLANGVWWIPSGAPARHLRLGDTVLGYEIERPFGEDSLVRAATVLWSTGGPQEITVFVGRDSSVTVYDSGGTQLKIKPRRDVLKLPLSGEPVLVTGLDATSLFPLELAETRLKEFELLLKQAEAEKRETAALRIIYNDARKALSSISAATVYNQIDRYVTALRLELRPYLWIEGESAAVHNFTGSAFLAGCSAGSYLKLDRPSAPVSGVYRARYAMDILREASYEVWVAGRIPGRPGVSPLHWQLDDETPVEVRSAAADAEYAAEMGWFSLGRLTLRPGRHEFAFFVTEKAGGEGGRFVAGIDALVLSRDPFRPRGVEKPGYRAPAPPAEPGRAK